jgi:8-oxo-dGTP diphosphatase
MTNSLIGQPFGGLLPVVAAALVDADGRLLMQRRPPGKAHAGLWEFPGGKIEAGESPEAALVREIDEELGIVIDGAAARPFTFASAPLGERHLLLLLYICRAWHGSPSAVEGQAFAWRPLAAWDAVAMPDGDRLLWRRLVATGISAA